MNFMIRITFRIPRDYSLCVICIVVKSNTNRNRNTSDFSILLFLNSTQLTNSLGSVSECSSEDITITIQYITYYYYCQLANDLLVVCCAVAALFTRGSSRQLAGHKSSSCRLLPLELYTHISSHLIFYAYIYTYSM